MANCKDLFIELCVCLWSISVAIVRAIFHSILPPPRKSVAGCNVLITGAANGLGHLLAVQFAKLGATLILWDIDETGLNRTRKEVEYLGASVHVYICDLRYV